MSVDQIKRTGRVINACVWTVAIAVMVFSLGTAFELLRAHEVPAHIAWILAPAVDAALVAALVGDRALHRVGVRVGWGTVLRITTGLMTLGLNVGRAISIGDWGGVAIHAIAPVLLIVLTEASQAYQLAFARAAAAASNDGTVPVSSPAVVQANVGTERVEDVPDSSRVLFSSGVDSSLVSFTGERLSGEDVPRRRAVGGTTPCSVSSRSEVAPWWTLQMSSRPANSRRVDVSDLREAGRKAFAAIEDQGRKVTRDGLLQQLRSNGVQVSTTRATELLRILRSELVAA